MKYLCERNYFQAGLELCGLSVKRNLRYIIDSCLVEI